MSDARWTPSRTTLVTGAAIVVLVVLLARSYQQFNGPSNPAPGNTAAASDATPAATRRAAPSSVRCTREPGSVPAVLAGDPCPDAVAAVEAAVADLGFAIDGIVIEPGPFYCDVVWPGIWSPVPCRGYSIVPGQFMHAWVSFHGSDELAAIMLGLDLPDDLNVPGATRPPWLTTLVTFQTPPAGWVMP